MIASEWDFSIVPMLTMIVGGGIVITIILMNGIIPYLSSTTYNCQRCLYDFRRQRKDKRFKCKYCQQEYIQIATGEIVKL